MTEEQGAGVCPHDDCGKTVKGIRWTEGGKPAPWGVCFACGRINVWNADSQSLRKATTEEARAAHDNMYVQQAFAMRRDAIRRIVKPEPRLRSFRIAVAFTDGTSRSYVRDFDTLNDARGFVSSALRIAFDDDKLIPACVIIRDSTDPEIEPSIAVMGTPELKRVFDIDPLLATKYDNEITRLCRENNREYADVNLSDLVQLKQAATEGKPC